MNNKKSEHSAEKAIRAVASKHGIGVETVRYEIEVAFATARENTDPKVQEFWNSVPRKGKTLTPEEVIAYVAGALIQNHR
ncbi:hypothetical protein SDC9_128749 [bioreactor metagenome]|uniref:Sporulation initiation factor Spo0A C-terminal domain-containing protein n=1 Tax=bioreactor metagenome TaxID=1076179 RepID=A0A645CYN5_9ZZZZ